MKTPKRLEPLIEDGLIDEVLRPLMSGKEAAVYVVRCGDELRCAKVYKEANKRSFRRAVKYREGRKVRSSRDARHGQGLQARAQGEGRELAERRGGGPVPRLTPACGCPSPTTFSMVSC